MIGDAGRSMGCFGSSTVDGYRIDFFRLFIKIDRVGNCVVQRRERGDDERIAGPDHVIGYSSEYTTR